MARHPVVITVTKDYVAFIDTDANDLPDAEAWRVVGENRDDPLNEQIDCHAPDEWERKAYADEFAYLAQMEGER